MPDIKPGRLLIPTEEDFPTLPDDVGSEEYWREMLALDRPNSAKLLKGPLNELEGLIAGYMGERVLEEVSNSYIVVEQRWKGGGRIGLTCLYDVLQSAGMHLKDYPPSFFPTEKTRTAKIEERIERIEAMRWGRQNLNFRNILAGVENPDLLDFLVAFSAENKPYRSYAYNDGAEEEKVNIYLLSPDEMPKNIEEALRSNVAYVLDGNHGAATNEALAKRILKAMPPSERFTPDFPARFGLATFVPFGEGGINSGQFRGYHRIFTGDAERAMQLISDNYFTKSAIKGDTEQIYADWNKNHKDKEILMVKEGVVYIITPNEKLRGSFEKKRGFFKEALDHELLHFALEESPSEDKEYWDFNYEAGGAIKAGRDNLVFLVGDPSQEQIVARLKLVPKRGVTGNKAYYIAHKLPEGFALPVNLASSGNVQLYNPAFESMYRLRKQMHMGGGG